jgi:hypothetical protein
LNSSLKAAQERASSLCTNFSRLMSLVIKEELDSIDRDMNQIRRGHYKVFEDQFRDATLEWEVKKMRAQTRLVASEKEIDIRFDSMADAEWAKFKVFDILRLLME